MKTIIKSLHWKTLLLAALIGAGTAWIANGQQLDAVGGKAAAGGAVGGIVAFFLPTWKRAIDADTGEVNEK